jgi:hypothetical protein
VGRPPHRAPYKRRYPSGRTVWIARYADPAGRTQYAKPRWNGGKSSFALKGDAQRAIDEALERLRGAGPALPQKLGEYFALWPDRHPRSKRTNKTNSDRISYALDMRTLPPLELFDPPETAAQKNGEGQEIAVR